MNLNTSIQRITYTFRRFVGILSVAFLPICTIAQENAEIGFMSNQILPASPTAASLGAFGDYPVNYSSGLPDINIPLLEVKGSTMSVPISLSYHGGGIKVNDISSWAGMGWTLNAGGVITKTVYGNEDGSALGIRNTITANVDLNNFNPETDQDDFQIFHNIAKNGWTADPDMYAFNFLGYTGQFYYDLDGNIHLISAQNIEIREIVGGYEISVGDGRIFTFTEKENTSATNSSNCSTIESAQSYTSAWYLKTITSEWETFTFNYQSELLEYPINRTESLMKAGNLQACIGEQTCHSYTTMEVTRKRLSSIQGPFKTASFTVNQNIETSAGAKVLSEITYDGITALFDFETESSTGSSWEGTTTTVRPFLNFVKLSADLQDDQTWDFTYNSVKLPNRFSYKVDHYGYFNGKTNISYFPLAEPHWSTGADREAVANKSKAGNLVSIKYPTGGITKFNWEQYSYKEDLVNPEEDKTVSYSAEPMSGEATYSKSIELGFDQRITMNYDIGVVAASENGEISVEGFGDQLYNLVGSGQRTTPELPAGTYTITVSNQGPPIQDVLFYFTYTSPETVTKVTRYTGGLRIGSIENFTKQDVSASKKVFEYLITSNDNKIIPNDYTGLSYSYINGSSGGFPVVLDECWHHTISSHPIYTKPEKMQYRVVIEKQVDENDVDIGQTKYTYLQANDSGGGVLHTPLHDRSWIRSLLESKEITDVNNMQVELVENNYSIVSENTITGIKASYIKDDPTHESFPPTSFDQLSYRAYDRISEWAKLNFTKITRTTPNGQQAVTTNYVYYRPTTHKYPNEMTHVDSEGRQRKLITLYPKDFNVFGNITANLQKDYFGLPVERVTMIDNKLSASSLAAYSSYGEPTHIWTSEPEKLASAYLYANGSNDPALKGDFSILPHYSVNEASITYGDYIGQVKENISRSGKSTYIWSYDNKLLLATFNGIDRTQLETLYNNLQVSNGLPELANLGNETDEVVLGNVLQTLRDNLPRGVLMTGYLYNPGVGIKAKITSEGLWEYYVYDSFYRLKQIKDQDGNITKEYLYNYKN